MFIQWSVEAYFLRGEYETDRMLTGLTLSTFTYLFPSNLYVPQGYVSIRYPWYMLTSQTTCLVQSVHVEATEITNHCLILETSKLGCFHNLTYNQTDVIFYILSFFVDCFDPWIDLKHARCLTSDAVFKVSTTGAGTTSLSWSRETGVGDGFTRCQQCVQFGWFGSIWIECLCTNLGVDVWR